MVFGLFKKSVEQQAVKELKKIRKQILKEKDGTVGVCMKFSTFITERKKIDSSTNYIREEDSPYPKLMIVLASLDLLNAWKKESSSGKASEAIYELMFVMSRACYIKSFAILDHEERKKIAQEALMEKLSPNSVMGEMEQIIKNPDYKVEDESPETVVEEKLELHADANVLVANEAWEKWVNTDFDAFEAIKSAYA